MSQKISKVSSLLSLKMCTPQIFQPLDMWKTFNIKKYIKIRMWWQQSKSKRTCFIMCNTLYSGHLCQLKNLQSCLNLILSIYLRLTSVLSVLILAASSIVFIPAFSSLFICDCVMFAINDKCLRSTKIFSIFSTPSSTIGWIWNLGYIPVLMKAYK